MAVVEMRRAVISAMKQDKEEILKKVQALGIMEVHKVEDEEPEGSGVPEEDAGSPVFASSDHRAEAQDAEKRVRILEQALNVLSEYAPEKSSPLSSLEGKEIVGRGDFDGTVSQKEDIEKTAEEILDLSKSISEKKAEIQKSTGRIDSLEPWKLLGTGLAPVKQVTERTTLLTGTMPPETTQDDIYEYVIASGEDDKDAEEPAFDVYIPGEDRDAIYVAVISANEDVKRVEDALRSHGFAKPAIETEKPPQEEIDEIKESIAELEKEIEEKSSLIAAKAGSREDIMRLSDFYRMTESGMEAQNELIESGRTFIVSGYVPKDQVDVLRKAIEGNFDAAIEIEEVGDDEDVPTVLRNNPFSSSTEGVIESYGLPNRKEFDPTTIMSFFYVFFFGLMLADGAYGLVMFAVCFFLVMKYKNMSPSMHKQLKLFMFCGLSTAFWGFMFGGFFGDAITVISKTFFGHEVTLPALWFVPLDDPMRLLIWCLGFGIVHLFVGLGIKGYQELKDGKKLDFFCDVVLWYLFLIGLLLMLIESDLFQNISQIEVSFPPVVSIMAKAFALIGVIGIVLMSGRDHKNPVLRIALGAYDVYGVTSWLSDVLSYSRLLALGLASGVIAQVVNQMGSMAGGGAIGAIIFILVFILGHSMNMAINILGAYVHTNRLQFVEFFGKFYDGGGRPLEPFEQNTKYVEVKEEM